MSKNLRITLPGGILHNDKLEKEVVLKPITGRLEQAILEQPEYIENVPGYVSNVLVNTISSIGELESGYDLVSELCVVDRQYIMQKLCQIIGDDQFWMNVNCDHCNEVFDVSIMLSQLPVNTAGDDYPYAHVHIGRYVMTVRMPNGSDQEKIRDYDSTIALKELLKLIVVEIVPEPANGVISYIDELSEEDINLIDDALDASSPGICTEVMTCCPECKQDQSVYLDPYKAMNTNNLSLVQQIHNIAFYYHWSESEILGLTSDKRKKYIKLIENAKGYVV